MRRKRWKKVISAVGAGVFLLGAVLAGGLSVKEAKAAELGAQQPADYFHKVEADSQQETIDALTTLYGISVQQEKDLYEKGTDIMVSLKATIHESLVKELDLEGLKNFEWKSDGSIKGKSGKINSRIYINEKQLINLITMTDNEKGTEYISIPELSKAYLKITGLVTSSEPNLMYKYLTKDMLNGLLKRYAKIITEGLNTVSLEENVEISAGGLNGKFNELTVTISPRELADIFKNLIREALKDDILMQLCVDAKICTEKEYIAALNEEMKIWEELKVEKLRPDKLPKLRIWVDGFGKIAGREFSIPSAYEDNEIGYMSVADGSNRGFELWSSDSGYDARIKINGVLSGGNVFSGDAEIKSENSYYDEKGTTTKINIKNAAFNNLKEGYLDGEFTVSNDVEKDMKTVIRCFGSPMQQNIKVDVIEKDVVLAAVIIDMKRGLYTDFNFPGNGDQVFDVDTEMEEYLDTADIEGFLNGIKERIDLPLIHEVIDEFLELL